MQRPELTLLLRSARHRIGDSNAKVASGSIRVRGHRYFEHRHILLLALLVSGCVGVEPYETRNNREKGPQKDLFTGSEGEFVIFRSTAVPETGDQTGKKSDENSDGEQPEMHYEEK